MFVFSGHAAVVSGITVLTGKEENLTKEDKVKSG